MLESSHNPNPNTSPNLNPNPNPRSIYSTYMTVRLSNPRINGLSDYWYITNRNAYWNGNTSGYQTAIGQSSWYLGYALDYS